MGRQDWVKASAAWAFDLTTNSYTLVVAKTSYEYDEQGRVTKTTFEGGTYTETGYDSLGRKADYTYDDAGRLTSVTLPQVWDAGRNQNSRPQYIYGYDAYGNMTTQQDAEGRVTTPRWRGGGRSRVLWPNAIGPANGRANLEYNQQKREAYVGLMV